MSPLPLTAAAASEALAPRLFPRSRLSSLLTRGCHGYTPEENIRALYLYPLRIRAGDAYPKCNMRKRDEDISILFHRNGKIISDPYPRYEIQDTGIYAVMRLPAPGENWLNKVDLSFRVPTIAELRFERLAATSDDPARPGWNRSVARTVWQYEIPEKK